MVVQAQDATIHSQKLASQAQDKLNEALRDQLAVGKIPLEAEHFLSREGRQIVLRVIFDERRSNLHYQHEVSPRELQLQRDAAERERFGQYLGRAIADRLAEAYAAHKSGSSVNQDCPA